MKILTVAFAVSTLSILAGAPASSETKRVNFPAIQNNGVRDARLPLSSKWQSVGAKVQRHNAALSKQIQNAKAKDSLREIGAPRTFGNAIGTTATSKTSAEANLIFRTSAQVKQSRASTMTSRLTRR